MYALMEQAECIKKGTYTYSIDPEKTPHLRRRKMRRLIRGCAVCQDNVLLVQW